MQNRVALEGTLTNIGADIILLTETHSREDLAPFGALVLNKGSPKNLDQKSHYGIAVAASDPAIRRNLRIMDTDIETFYTVMELNNLAIIGVYLSPSKSTEDCVEILRGALNEVPARLKRRSIILGDFNMRLDLATGCSYTCSRGAHINSFLEERNFRLNPFDEPRGTFIAPLRDGRFRSSTVDLIYCSQELLTSIFPVYIDSDTYFSDHFPIFIEIMTRDIENEMQPKVAVSRLKKEKTLKKYTERLEELSFELDQDFRSKLDEIMNGPSHRQGTYLQTMVDTMDNRLTNTILEEVRAACGYIKEGVRFRFFDDGIIQAIRKMRKQVINSIRSSRMVGLPVSEDDINTLKSLNRIYKYQVRTLQKKHIEEYYSNLEDCEPIELLKATKRLLNGKKRKNTQIDPTKAQDFAHQFSSSNDPKDEAGNPILSMPIPDSLVRIRKDQSTQVALVMYFHQHIIENQIAASKNGKAPGPSLLSVEMLKPVKKLISFPLSLLFETIVRTGVCPSGWCRATVIPVPKKPGAKLPKDHRPISLTEVFRRIFEKCLLHWMKRRLDGLSIEQSGFRDGRSIFDAIAALQEIISSERKLGNKLAIAFLDIKATFDTVDREIL